MRDVARLLRRSRAARWFFLALAQSSLGTGAAYVALLLVAFERLDSPWAISLVLLADLLPAMLLGPFFGAVADRWSRRTCVVAADVIRAVAFIGVALVDSFGATLALAALAGTGTALFTPAALAGLPSLVEDDEVPAATSLYGAIADLGFTAGPALAALALLLGGPEEILLVNGATFAASAVILALLPFGAVQPSGETRVGAIARALIRETREGLAIVARMRDIRVVIGASAMALFFGGLFNVAELPFASEELGTDDAGYAVLVAAFGLGFVGGSLAGSKGGTHERLRGRFTSGIALFGARAAAVGHRAVGGARPPGVRCGGLRQRAAARARAGAGAGVGARRSAGARLRRQGRARVLGVRPGVLLRRGAAHADVAARADRGCRRRGAARLGRDAAAAAPARRAGPARRC